MAAELAARESGFLSQRRLTPHPGLSRLFGSTLCSVRLLVLLTADGLVVHRTVAKIATGANPADNFWRSGNMLGAVDRDTGVIWRVVRGTGADMVVDEADPDTGQPITGNTLPGWTETLELARTAVQVLPGTLAQRLDLSLNFGQVRKLLCGMVGMSPSYPAAERLRGREEPAVPPAERWAGRGRLRQGLASWAYLAVTRALPPGILQAAGLVA